MIVADGPGFASPDRLRALCAADPTAHALTFVRALNSMALDFDPLPRAMDYLDEAAFDLTRLIDADGATPERLHHLVMVLANQAQCAAFSGATGWSDLPRALDASAQAVVVQREQVAHAVEAGAPSVPEARAVLAELLLLSARIHAACAQLDEAEDAYREAEEIIRRENLHEQWGDALRTVGAELGVDLGEWGARSRPRAGCTAGTGTSRCDPGLPRPAPASARCTRQMRRRKGPRAVPEHRPRRRAAESPHRTRPCGQPAGGRLP
ncbi:hypothetical protein [Demequina subtropica]|uniref:hypothetical protein n=1 Tax=Demequina subtropica TaxID=1638989 RepID=UPI0007860888|nr:hypothetical protein [Demequina subtropica]